MYSPQQDTVTILKSIILIAASEWVISEKLQNASTTTAKDQNSFHRIVI